MDSQVQVLESQLPNLQKQPLFKKKKVRIYSLLFYL